MRCATAVLLLSCSASIWLSSCNSEPTRESAFSPTKPGFDIGQQGPACGPNLSHPGGLIVDRVDVPGTFGVAVRDDGLTYFTEGSGVGITSTSTRTVDGFIPTGDVPTGLDFAPDGATAYVTNQLSSNVGVIDVATAQQVATISVAPANPFVVRVSPDGAQLFISTNTTTVYIADTRTRAIIGSVEVGYAPNAFAVHPDGRIIYVSAFVGGTVTEVDLFTHQVLRTFSVGGAPQDMAVSRDGKRLYVAAENGFLDEITLLTGQVTAQIPLNGTAFGIGVTPDDNQAYVSLVYEGQVKIFNLQSRRLSQTLQVDGYPRRIAFSQQGHIGAIANQSGYITFVR